MNNTQFKKIEKEKTYKFFFLFTQIFFSIRWLLEYSYYIRKHLKIYNKMNLNLNSFEC